MAKIQIWVLLPKNPKPQDQKPKNQNKMRDSVSFYVGLVGRYSNTPVFSCTVSAFFAGPVSSSDLYCMCIQCNTTKALQLWKSFVDNHRSSYLPASCTEKIASRQDKPYRINELSYIWKYNENPDFVLNSFFQIRRNQNLINNFQIP